MLPQRGEAHEHRKWIEGALLPEQEHVNNLGSAIFERLC